MKLAAIISALCLTCAYVWQYVFHWQPCFLCTLARVPHGAFLAIYAAAFFFPQQKRLWSTLGMLVFSSGAALAVYHIGVEQNWWEASSLCTQTNLPSFGSMLHVSSSPRIASCREYTPFLFSLSMTVYNLLACLLALSFLIHSKWLCRSHSYPANV